MYDDIGYKKKAFQCSKFVVTTFSIKFFEESLSHSFVREGTHGTRVEAKGQKIRNWHSLSIIRRGTLKNSRVHLKICTSIVSVLSKGVFLTRSLGTFTKEVF